MIDLHRRIAARVVPLIPCGAVVNLGIGIPTLIADLLAPESGIHVHTENGLLGVGARPLPGAEDPLLVNAGKQPVTARPGAAYFSSSTSFAMIRGGHVDVAVLGALQVDRRGRVANWAMPGRPILGVGGAMDLLDGAAAVIVATTHLSKDGAAKLVESCTVPLTGRRPVNLVVTEHATFSVDADGLTLRDREPACDLAWLREHTPATFRVMAHG